MEILMALLMGVAYKASPGPVNIETLRRGMTGGVPSAFAVQAGAMIGYLFYAFVAFWGMNLFAGMSFIQLILTVLSVMLLLYLGVAAIRDRGIFEQMIADEGELECSVHKSFFTGCLLSFFNPISLAFWVAISNRTNQISVEPSLFLVAFFVGVLLVATMITIVASHYMSRIRSSWAQGILVSCGLVMIAFGLKIGYGLVIAL